MTLSTLGACSSVVDFHSRMVSWPVSEGGSAVGREAAGSASPSSFSHRFFFLEGRCTCTATSPVLQCDGGSGGGDVGGGDGVSTGGMDATSCFASSSTIFESETVITGTTEADRSS